MSTTVLKFNTSMESTFDAKVFGKWLLEQFEKSHFKSYAQLGKAVGVGRATISRYILAGKQELTDKPSRPREPIVRELAKVLNADLATALAKAGYASKSPSDLDFVIRAYDDRFDSEDIAKIKEYIELLALKKKQEK